MIAWILVAVGVVLLVVSAIDAGRSRRADDEAIEILRARFARAEIDADQFTKAKQTLGPSQRVTPASRRSLLSGAGLLVAGLIIGLVAWASLGGYGGMMGLRMMGMMGPAPTAPEGTSVRLAGARFAPATLAIQVGDTVRWFNDDTLPHTVTAVDHSWDSGPLAPGTPFERRFDSAGTYAYVCLYHSWMAGSIVVSSR